MRIDKFLKSSRLVKRRTVAKELADAGRVAVNGRVAKAGTEVVPGDIVTLRYGNRTVEVRVLRLLENPRKDAAGEMYELLSATGPAGGDEDPDDEEDERD
ncbi:RNA-binding S4 domain-containing protein [Alicyclobacillus sp.]|uniref:RNA-binding S4 domain-containing protein n=1 Tax=Alicyclobacillus sp. TaxID=61169 RepID=UPI0025B9361B|nr:RNA-binding S4 domain-containing protein [Alicyclobacillus sp.]MCL6517708.1 RNA-binding S4 domain-containing protein [Alicyclobacillus sp.]